MGYIENNLMHEENLVHVTRLHPIILMWPAMAVSFLAGTLSLVRDEEVLFIPALILFLLCGVKLVNRIIYFVTSEYGITSKRVLGKTGFIHRNSKDIVLNKVEAVSLSQNVLGRLLNYGTIEVTGTGGTEESLQFIPDPLAFRNRIQEQLSEAEERGEVSRAAVDG
jgi:uncharacterized membrane protein YdbT with pleckstrin-like domain